MTKSKKIRVMLDGEPIEFYLARKEDLWLHKAIAALPLIPKSYMTRFWSTIGGTVAVPERQGRALDFGEPSWIAKYAIPLRHEARHIRNSRRFTFPVFATYYVGPSVTVCLPMLLFWLVWGLVTGSWFWLAMTAIAFVVMLPLSTGLAIGRALEEWYAYEESIRVFGRGRLEAVADTLWENYVFTIPRSYTRRWFAKRLDRPEWSTPPPESDD